MTAVAKGDRVVVPVVIACEDCFFCKLLAATGGGFDASEAPPPDHKQEDGIKGSEDAREATVKTVVSGGENSWVTLEGNIIKKTGEARYLFRDKTGSITIIINDDKWDSQKVTPKDLVSISGRFGKEKSPPLIRAD